MGGRERDNCYVLWCLPDLSVVWSDEVAAMIRRLWHQRFGHPGPVQCLDGNKLFCYCGVSAQDVYAHGRTRGDVGRYQLSNKPLTATERNVWSP